MTVSAQTPYSLQAANGVTTAFPFAYKIRSNSDIVVTLADASGNETAQTLGVHYTVSGSGGSSGTVTFLAAPANGLTVKTRRVTVLDRSTDYQSNGDLLAAIINGDVDAVWLALQELASGTQSPANSVRAPTGEVVTQLLPAVQRKDRALVFNSATGQPETSSFTVTQLASVVAAVYAAAAGPLDALSFLQAGVGAVSRSAQDKIRERISVFDFMTAAQIVDVQAGTMTQDVTVAIQAAMTATLSVNGGALYFPPGTYKITAALTIPLWTGWRIFGASRGNTKIVQATSNTPIFRFTSSLAHSWKIDGITFAYAAQQHKASHPLSVVFYLDSGTDTSIFNFAIEDCVFSNTYKVLGVNTAALRLSVWGFRFYRCTLNGTCTGALCDIVSGASVGDPNIAFEQLYLDCTAQEEETIKITAADQVTLKDVEFNNGSYSTFNQMSITSSSMVTLVNVKVEVMALVNARYAWDFAQSVVTAIGVKFLAVTCSGAGTSGMMSGATGASLTVIGMFVSTSGNTAVVYQFDEIKLAANVSVAGTASHRLRTVLGNVAMPRVNADYQSRDYTETRGDVTVVLTGTNGRVQRFNTTLTANRSVTLPSSGIEDGTEFNIVRDAAVPGAFTLTVIDPVSGIGNTIAAGTKGYVRYRAIASNQYMIVAAGTLP